MAIRLVIVEHHYRTAWEWDDTRMPRAAERLERWRAAGDGRRRRSTRSGPRSTTTSTRPGAVAAIDAAAAAGEGVSRGRRPCSASCSADSV